MIGIKNLSGEKLEARYDGKDFEFPADPKVVTPLGEDAARHIFGYGEKDKARALMRLGWLNSGSPASAKEGTERLGKFQFLAVEIKIKDEEPVQLPRTLKAEGDAALLQAAESAHGERMAEPKGAQQKFAHKQ